MNKDTSPPVHPTGVEHGFNNGVAGMTLLQYYAGQALQGIIACPDDYEEEKQRREDWYGACGLLAESAFDYAEAMLAEYNKRYGVDAEIGKTK